MTTLRHLPDYWRDHFLDIASRPCKDSSESLSLRNVLLSLRDMPYARPSGGNTVRDCITEWTGTCSAKHMAVHEWLTLMGYAPQFWMACYIMDFSRPYFSDQLRAAASGCPVHDVHNFVTCDLGQGEITIDITFPEHLSHHASRLPKPGMEPATSSSVAHLWNKSPCTISAPPINANAAGCKR